MVTYLTEFLQEKRERAALVSAREMVGSQEAFLVPKNCRQVSGCYDPPIITHLSLHLVIYCLGCIAIAVHDFMAPLERGNTQYRYSMHFYIKGDINCFAERMYSVIQFEDHSGLSYRGRGSDW